MPSIFVGFFLVLFTFITAHHCKNDFPCSMLIHHFTSMNMLSNLFNINTRAYIRLLTFFSRPTPVKLNTKIKTSTKTYAKIEIQFPTKNPILFTRYIHLQTKYIHTYIQINISKWIFHFLPCPFLKSRALKTIIYMRCKMGRVLYYIYSIAYILNSYRSQM